MRKALLALSALMASAAVIVLVSCGSGGNGMNAGGGTGAGSATLSTMISDPATCLAPSGPFQHVFITVADVKASTNANAGDNDPSFVDLTPGLKPVQVDLLGTATTGCFLAQLAQNANIPAGTYQQIRIFLLANTTNTPPANNQCGTSVNCVVLSNSVTQPLQLSSEATTGIKIPSGQIAGGQFTVASGGSADLDIDFNACESVVQQGSGQFRLLPVLHAGEVSLTGAQITGNVVDSATQTAISGGTVMVALEQKDANGVDRVVMQTTADANGNFTFCPVSSGTYDIVADAVNGAGTVYAATITTGVQSGNTVSNIPLIATTGAAAGLTGIVNTAGTNAPTSALVLVSALQSANGALFTVPLASQVATTQNLTTQPGGTCAANNDCGSYTVNVPVGNPNAGAAGGPYSQASGAVSYTMDALAFVPGTANTPDCLTAGGTPEDMQVAVNNVVASPAPTPSPLNFTNCQ